MTPTAFVFLFVSAVAVRCVRGYLAAPSAARPTARYGNSGGNAPMPVPESL